MRFIKAILIVTIIFTFFLTMTCTKEKIVDSNEQFQKELVPVQVDLQTGVDDYRIIIKFNDEQYFDAALSKIIPLAGHIASFTTNLSRGQNTLDILSQYLGVAQVITNQESFSIILGSSAKYYLGIELSNGKFNVKIQDVPFHYLKL